MCREVHVAHKESSVVFGVVCVSRLSRMYFWHAWRSQGHELVVGFGRHFQETETRVETLHMYSVLTYYALVRRNVFRMSASRYSFKCFALLRVPEVA